MRWLLALVLVAPLWAPTAAAGPVPTVLSIDAVDSPMPLWPEIGQGKVTLHWTYASTMAGGNVALASQRQAVLSWQPIVCQASPDQVRFAGPLTETIDLWPGYPNPPPEHIEGTSEFTVTATREAPGETQLRCQTTGKVEAPEGNAFADSNEVVAVFTVSVRYFPAVQATVLAPIQEAGPQKAIRFDIDASNLGNSRTLLRFDLPGDVPAGWEPVVPEPVVLDALPQGGAKVRETIPFHVYTPYQEGWNSGEASFRLRITPVSTLDEQEGAPVEVSVLARVRGLYCSDPQTEDPQCQAALQELRSRCKAGSADGKEAEACPLLEAKASPAAWAMPAILAAALLLRRRTTP